MLDNVAFNLPFGSAASISVDGTLDLESGPITLNVPLVLNGNANATIYAPFGDVRVTGSNTISGTAGRRFGLARQGVRNGLSCHRQSSINDSTTQ